MSWTRSILDAVGGQPNNLYHFLSTIAASLSWCIVLFSLLPWYFLIPIAAVLGFLTMLVWEVAQYYFDSGFQPDDIRSNALGAGFSLPLLSGVLAASVAAAWLANAFL